MYLLYCDETNLEERSGDFFIYGGLAISADEALPLSLAIEKIRDKFKVDRKFRLKFNPKPENISHNDFNNMKENIIKAAHEHGAIFFTSMILHDIATSPKSAQMNEINRVCYNFNCFLKEKKKLVWF